MKHTTYGQRLQHAYRQHIEPYCEHVQCAATLTLKQRATISVKRFANYGDECYQFAAYLNEHTLNSTIQYFTAQLTRELYGNNARQKGKRDWAKPLLLVVVEGRNTHKLTHLHLAIGNIPATHIGNIDKHIQAAFSRCDFANKQLCVKHVSNSVGWLGYITKQVGYTDNDALDIVSSTIPASIQQSICTESRLLTA